jgi:hypothetical protein
MIAHPFSRGKTTAEVSDMKSRKEFVVDISSSSKELVQMQIRVELVANLVVGCVVLAFVSFVVFKLVPDDRIYLKGVFRILALLSIICGAALFVYFFYLQFKKMTLGTKPEDILQDEQAGSDFETKAIDDNGSDGE